MVVAMTSDLMHLAPQLRRRGFHVVAAETYRKPVDALVYSGSLATGNLMSASSFGDGRGILMVPAWNQDVETIAQCLKRKTYSMLLE